MADEHFHPGNKLSKKVVLFDELVPGEIMAGFPNLIYLPAQVLPVLQPVLVKTSTSRTTPFIMPMAVLSSAVSSVAA